MNRKPFIIVILAMVLLLLLGPYLLFFFSVSHQYSLSLSGEKGSPFIGKIKSDGSLKKVEGVLPSQFQFQSKEIEFAFALVKPQAESQIAVHVWVDDDQWGNCHSTGGVKGALQISGLFGGNIRKGYIGSLNPSEVEKLKTELIVRER